MPHSPLLGTDPAPAEPAGRDTRLLGPSDSSDSGSDLAGIDTGGDTGLPLQEALQEAGQNLDAPADIEVDRVVTPHRGTDDETVSDDEDADLAFIDRAQAGDPLEDEAVDEAAAPQPDPREPNPAPDGPAPTEPGNPVDAPADPGDDEQRRPGRVAALLRPR